MQISTCSDANFQFRKKSVQPNWTCVQLGILCGFVISHFDFLQYMSTFTLNLIPLNFLSAIQHKSPSNWVALWRSCVEKCFTQKMSRLNNSPLSLFCPDNKGKNGHKSCSPICIWIWYGALDTFQVGQFNLEPACHFGKHNHFWTSGTLDGYLETLQWRGQKWPQIMLPHVLGCDMVHLTLSNSRWDPHPRNSHLTPIMLAK